MPSEFVAASRRAIEIAPLMAVSKSHQHENFHDHPACVHAGKFGCFRVAADRVSVAAKARSRREEGHCHPDADRNEDRNGDAVGDEKAALGKRDMVRLRVAPHAAGRAKDKR